MEPNQVKFTIMALNDLNSLINKFDEIEPFVLKSSSFLLFQKDFIGFHTLTFHCVAMSYTNSTVDKLTNFKS